MKQGELSKTQVKYEYYSQMALSPDGQSLAYLKYEAADVFSAVPIIVATANGSHELDFAANRIQWGASDHTFVPVYAGGTDE